MKKAVLFILIVMLIFASVGYTLYMKGELPYITAAANDEIYAESTSEPDSSQSSEPEQDQTNEKEIIPDIVKSSDEVKSKLDALSEKYDPVSVSIAAFEKDKILFSYNYGYIDLKTKTPCNEDTKYRVASLSKTYTALTAMHMVDEGILDLDKDIGEYLGYKVRSYNYPNVPITTRMLLTHTSSVYDCQAYTESISGGNYTPVKTILSGSMGYSGAKPGGQYRYSNFGIAVAACVIEKAANTFFNDYSSENILKPLGADASFIASQIIDKGNIAACYSGRSVTMSKDQLLRAARKSALGNLMGQAPGSLTISAKDYSKGLSMLLCQGEYAGERILSEKSAEEMMKIQFSSDSVDQALCMKLIKDFAPDRDLICHSGDAYGVLAAYAIDPLEKTGVVVITNGARQVKDKDTNYYSVCADMIKTLYEYM